MEDSVPDDAAHLKSLRMAAGLDVAQLAALSNLSAGQVRQLEEGGESLFYSAQIKAQSMRRVMRLLAAPVDQPNSNEQPAPNAVRASANVIEDIIRLSEKSLNSQVVHTDVRRRRGVMSHPWAVGWLAIALLGWVVWQSNHQATEQLFDQWLESGSVNPLATSSSEQPLATVPEPAPYQASALTTEMVTPNLSLPSTKATQPAVSPLATAPLSAKPIPPGEPLKNTPAALASTGSSSDNCTSISSEPVHMVKPVLPPSKPGSYIYLQSSKPLQVCVDDGKQKQILVTLTPGTGRTVKGHAPWTIASSDLKSVQIYFQGSKVWLPADAGQRILLTEQAVSP